MFIELIFANLEKAKVDIAKYLFLAFFTISPCCLLAQTETLDERVTKLERLVENQALLGLLEQVDLLQKQVRNLQGSVDNQGFELVNQEQELSQALENLRQRLQVLENSGHFSVTGEHVRKDGAFDESVVVKTIENPENISVDQRNETNKQQSTEEESDERLVRKQVNISDPEGGLFRSTENEAVVPPISGDPSSETDFSIRPRPSVGLIDETAAEEAYRTAFGILKEGRYEDSIESFESYLLNFPESQYADNAQYWLGETYYVMRKFLSAIDEYNKLVEHFPQSKKKSHAILKIGYSYYELRMMDESAKTLKELIKQFPDSAASRLAEERLARISTSTE